MDEEPPLNVPDTPPKSRPLFAVGVVLTLVYLTGITAYWFTGADQLLNLTPEGFGNFLAGIFAPLAFLWLVLGFLQQGDELRNSADALWLQGRELQHSVEQQRELVKVTREQLSFESDVLQQQRAELIRNTQPILSLVETGSGGAPNNMRLYYFRLLNHGKPCTAVAIVTEKGSAWTTPVLNTGANFDFNIDLPSNGFGPLLITVSYLDERLLAGKKAFKIASLGGILRIEPAEDEASPPRLDGDGQA